MTYQTDPDYASYDAVQLRQALRTIDTARFPERTEEINARLAALELAQQSAPPSSAGAAPDCPLALAILQRVGKVLVIIGIIDIAVMIYAVAHGGWYSSTLNIFALIAGIFLWRGGLRAASIVRWIAWASVPAALTLPIIARALQPLDLTLTELRLSPGAVLLSAALVIGYGGLLVWLIRELGSAPVLAARMAAGRPRRDMRIPFALGVAASLGGLWLMVHVLGGERAGRAQTMAAEKLGAGYRYHTSSMHVFSGSGGTAVNASVVAWNPASIITVQVQWRE